MCRVCSRLPPPGSDWGWWWCGGGGGGVLPVPSAREEMGRWVHTDTNVGENKDTGKPAFKILMKNRCSCVTGDLSVSERLGVVGFSDRAVIQMISGTIAFHFLIDEVVA